MGKIYFPLLLLTFGLLPIIFSGERTWKRYFIARDKIEIGVATGRPGHHYVCKTFRGHNGLVADVVFLTTNGIYDEEIIDNNAYPVIASCSQDKSVCIWNVREGKSLWKKSSHEASVTSLELIAHNSPLASGDVEGGIKLWDVSSGVHTALQGSHSDVITAMQCRNNVIGKEQGDCSSHLLMVGFRDGCVKMWDTRITANPQFELMGQFGLSYMKLQADHLLATASKFESTAKMLDIRYLAPDSRKGPEPRSLRHPSYATVTCLCWVPTKQNHLIVGYNNGNIILWNGNSGQLVHCFKGHAGDVSCVCSLESTAVTAGYDHTVRLWDLNSLEDLQTHKDHKGPVTGLYVGAYRAISCSRDYSIRTYCWTRTGSSSSRSFHNKYTLLGGSLQRAGNGFEKVICDYSACVGMATDVLKTSSFQI